MSTTRLHGENFTLFVDNMTIPDNTIVNSMLRSDAAIARAKLAQDALAVYPIKLSDFRVHDALHTNLPGTSSGDDLALVGGTLGTAHPLLQTSDLKAAGSTTLYGRTTIALPPEYESAETVQLRVSGAAVTTVADTAMTVDVEAYKIDRDGTVSADLVTTAAQDINSLTYADKDFTVTPTALQPGDQLDVRLALLVNDAASGTEVKGSIAAVELLCDIRG